MGAKQQAAQASLAAMFLAGSLGAMAQGLEIQTQDDTEDALETVVVQGKREGLGMRGKDSIRATESSIGKGKQKLRDIPQSVTVVTERLLEDRHIDTVKEALKNTAGVTFLAAENGEEDIRLRGFSLAQTGDIFVDGLRDPAFYDRDIFNLDRMEVLRGSASMLFGRGSTGGALNQVSKIPLPLEESQAESSVGSYNYRRVRADINRPFGSNSALRITGMATKADNNGAGSSIDKNGVAASVRMGMGQVHEWMASLYYLNNRNGVNYGLPWLATGPAPEDRSVLPRRQPTDNFGMASDYNHGSAGTVTLSHTWRPDSQTEWTTRLRKGEYARDLRASQMRFAPAAQQPGGVAVNAATLSPNTVFSRGDAFKIQNLDNWTLQSDLNKKFEWAGRKHEVLAGWEWSQDEKEVWTPRSSAQGGVNLMKPTGTMGSPDQPAVYEASRVLRKSSNYTSQSWGAYAQDMLHLSEKFKVVGGLRYDHLNGSYTQYAIPNAAPAPVTRTNYQMQLGEWSPRLGFLYQPNEQYSWYASYGRSFNPSSEAYSLSAANAHTPPEKSRNIEFGVKAETANRRLSWRASIFHTTKYNERNTDPLLLVPGTTTPVTALTGQRHATGLEFDASGRITPAWEVFGSWAWIPIAKVDRAAPCPPAPAACAQAAVGERPGDRPALTPKLSGTAWTTYQVSEAWRVGAGVNYRSAQRPTRAAWTVPAVTTVDLMAEYRPNENWTVKGNVSNAGNQYYADQLYPGFYVPGAGRNVQLTATYVY